MPTADNDGWPLDLATWVARPADPSAPGGIHQVGKSEDGSTHHFPIFKATPKKDEQIVLGVVLAPETRDAQGDIYSDEEVAKAAYGFMEKWRRTAALGEQHSRKLAEEEADLLESYLAPVDFTIGSRLVKAGTWLMKWRVKSAALWAKIKSGAITGFSIGGSAIKTPG